MVREGRCGSLGVRGVAHTKGEGLVEQVCGKELVFTADQGVEITQKGSGVSGEGGVEGNQGIVDQGHQEQALVRLTPIPPMPRFPGDGYNPSL